MAEVPTATLADAAAAINARGAGSPPQSEPISSPVSSLADAADALRRRGSPRPPLSFAPELATGPQPPGQSRELGKKLKEIGESTVHLSQTMFWNWAHNVNPRGKDKAWVAGMAVGAAEQIALVYLPGPANRFARAGINFAVTGAVGIGVRRHRMMQENQLREAGLSKDEFDAQLKILEENYQKTAGFLKGFCGGLAASGTYFSLTGMALSAYESYTGSTVVPNVWSQVGSWWENRQTQPTGGGAAGAVAEATQTSTPTPTVQAGVPAEAAQVLPEPSPTVEPSPTTAPATSTAVVEPSPTPTTIPATATSVAPTEIPPSPTVPPSPTTAVATATPEPAPTTVPAAPAPAPAVPAPAPGMTPPDLAEIDKQLQDGISATVGKQLGKIKEITNGVLQAQGIDPAKLPSDQYEKARMAIQRQFEKLANYDYLMLHTPAGGLQNPADLASALSSGEVDYNKGVAFVSSLDPKAWVGGQAPVAMPGYLSTDEITQAVSGIKRAVLEARPDFNIGIQAAVGAHLDQSNTVATEYLSHSTFEEVRKAAQSRLEDLANKSFDKATEFFNLTGEINNQTVNNTTSLGREFFEQSLQDSQVHQQMLDFLHTHSPKALTFDYLVHSSISPDQITQVPLHSGDTFGQLLVNNGYDLTSWGPEKARLFGAHLALDYDIFKDGYLQQVGNLEGFPKLEEIAGLVKRAETGDNEAIKKLQVLKNAMGRIQVGGKALVVKKAYLDAIAGMLFGKK